MTPLPEQRGARCFVDVTPSVGDLARERLKWTYSVDVAALPLRDVRSQMGGIGS